jgi:predicted dehydrogenase
VERCIAAGKAVVQEKPVAATVAEAVTAIERYRRAVAEAGGPQRAPLWMFAENYRRVRGLGEARRARREGGRSPGGNPGRGRMSRP